MIVIKFLPDMISLHCNPGKSVISMYAIRSMKNSFFDARKIYLMKEFCNTFSIECFNITSFLLAFISGMFIHVS